ncbi:hypothetical protein V1511DRAFT_496639 [Dipodascopsis uninucleata]
MSDEHRSNSSNWRRRPAQNQNQQSYQSSQYGGSHRQQGGNVGHDSHGFSAAQHVPVRNFNSKEVEDFLNKEYSAAQERARESLAVDENAASKNKPVLYQSNQKGWNTSTKSSAWSQRGNVTTKGSSVLGELRKGFQNL